MKNLFRKIRKVWHNDLQRSVVYEESIFSYCQNLFFCKEVKESDVYKYIREVHELTKVYDVISPEAKKCRVGSKQDGGYIMIRPYSRNKIAYSFGISTDVSWDESIAAEGYEIYQYDHTIKKLPSENEHFHWKKIGLTGSAETSSLKHLDQLIRSNGHEKETGMLLKMDIEGYEWDVFANTDLSLIDKFDQITMEFHNLLNFSESKKYLEVLRKLASSFWTVHVHANNYAPIYFCGDLVMPSSLELTFLRKDIFEVRTNDGVFPTLLDIPNIGAIDFMLGKW